MQIIVEFYGVPRQRAGRAEVAVLAGTVGEVLAAVERTCPGLKGLVDSSGKLSPHYLLSIDGGNFAVDMLRPLEEGDRLLLLSADAGG